ncbi:hypothetical protein [Streptomyces sp. NPDC101776]|uniref:hypothetical protein n=1 Tax=Streptomyces sp. NPDC101776 TaxID=3366146 RepID=UPI00381AD549
MNLRFLLPAHANEVGVSRKQANAYNISVARKASVALMDTRVGLPMLNSGLTAREFAEEFQLPPGFSEM